MSQVQSIIERARNWTRQPRHSKARLAKEVGLHPNTLRNLDDADVQFKTATLDKLEAFFNKEVPT